MASWHVSCVQTYLTFFFLHFHEKSSIQFKIQEREKKPHHHRPPCLARRTQAEHPFFSPPPVIKEEQPKPLTAIGSLRCGGPRAGRLLASFASYHQFTTSYDRRAILTLSINQPRRHSPPSPSRPAPLPLAIPPFEAAITSTFHYLLAAVAAAVGCACSFPVLCELRGPLACVLCHLGHRFLPFTFPPPPARLGK
jgi:hypothetical protein